MPFDWTRALSPVCLLSFHNSMNFCMPKLLFSSPGPKVQVNYCHHLAFVVCRPLSSFFFETTGPIGTKLSRNVPWMVLYKILFFVPVGYSTWLPGPIICSDWLKFLL